jgi:hypothetical protein
LKLATYPAGTSDVYWDDFLGNADKSWTGHPEPSHDDRLFTTAVSLNALIDTWSFWSPDSQSLQFLPNVPANVSSVIARASGYLATATQAGKLRLDNSFFSGSVKGDTSLPFSYPANLIRFVNGTIIPPLNATTHDASDNVAIAMLGVISEVRFSYHDGDVAVLQSQLMFAQSEYDALLAAHPFNSTTPTTFDGYNTSAFPYWTSDEMTMSVIALALAKAAQVTAA